MAQYLETEDPVIHLIANGTTTGFQIPFSFLRDTDIEVYINTTEKSLNIDYTVTGDYEDAKGVVSFFTAPEEFAIVTIIRSTEETRVTDFETAARFNPLLLDSEFNNLLRMIADARMFNLAAPTFHPKDIGNVNGVLPEIIPKGVIRFNEAGDGFEVLDLNNVPELVDLVNQAQGWADAAAASATSAEDDRILAEDAQQGADTAYLGAELAKEDSMTYATRSEQYATNPENIKVPTTDDYSALHWAAKSAASAVEAAKSAAKAMEAASASLIWGGAFSPTLAQEYPDVTGITQDTQWAISLTEDYTFTTGDLIGNTVKGGDFIVYDTPNNTWTLVSINREPECNRKITYGTADAPTTGVREEGEIYFKILT